MCVCVCVCMFMCGVWDSVNVKLHLQSFTKLFKLTIDPAMRVEPLPVIRHGPLWMLPTCSLWYVSTYTCMLKTYD